MDSKGIFFMSALIIRDCSKNLVLPNKNEHKNRKGGAFKGYVGCHL